MHAEGSTPVPPLNGAAATSRKPRRRRPAPAQKPAEPTHLELMQRAMRDAQDAKERTDQLHLVVQRIENRQIAHVGDMAALLKAIGDEDQDDHGERIGTGLTGRLMRLEESVRLRFRTYDRWTAMATAGAAVAGVAALIIWWLVENRVAFLR